MKYRRGFVKHKTRGLTINRHYSICVAKASLIIAIIVVSVATTLYLVETAVSSTTFVQPWRWLTENAVISQTGKLLYKLDKNLIYKFSNDVWINDFWATDINGFRYNPVFDPPSTKDPIYSIVVVGDSIIYGHGVKHNETFTFQLQKLLSSSGVKTKIYNAGTPGYGPDQEYLLINTILKNKNPSIVIWNFNMENDFDDANDACLFMQFWGRYYQIPGWLNTMFIEKKLLGALPAFIRNFSVTKLLIYSPNIITKKTRFSFFCTSFLPKDIDGRMIEKTTAFIKTLLASVRSGNTKLLITLSPFQWYFDPDAMILDVPDIKRYNLFVKTLQASGLSFFDGNQEIGLLVSPTHQPPACPDNTIDKRLSAFATNLFLKDASFSYGKQHLSAEGNRLFACIAAPIIKKMLKG